jgi:hypothetical protein
MQQFMSFYPAGNDPNLALDRGLNFSGLRFNAPFRQQDNATVGKMDFILDKASQEHVWRFGARWRTTAWTSRWRSFRVRLRRRSC